METENLEDIYELSPTQQGMLFYALYDPKAGAYFEQITYSFHGVLNVPAFERAWQHVMDRHPILRTSFFWEDVDKPLQVVHRQVKLPLERDDWRGLSPVEQQERLEHFLQTDRDRYFDLSEAPLMRLTLIQVAEDAYQFIWSTHHLLLDGWSQPLVLKEVSAFYKAFCQGENIHLELPRPYGDYIEWLQQQDLTEAETFWRQVLKGFSAPISLAIDRAPGSLPSLGEVFEEQGIQLSVAATAALQSYARRHRFTMNTLVQGAWALLLSRYSADDDVIFGVTVSGRPAALAEVESMVGLFINTLPVRVRVSPGDSCLSWLKKLQDQMVELRQYEYTPLVEIQAWSEVPRSLPLFENILVYENFPADGSLLGLGGSLDIHSARVSRTNYPLTVLALPGPQLELRIIYHRSRFDKAAIARMLGHFQTLLEGIVANPEQPISTLALLTKAERHQLLVEWNDTKRDYPQDQCIHELFEAQAERTPDAVSVIFEDQQLT